jgi:hypothetical protein
MKTLRNAAPLTLTLLALLAVGCAQDVQTPLIRAEPPTQTTPTWGSQIEGLQCRLRPTKRLWNPQETITFKIDLRNRGTRLFAFDAREPIHADRIALNGRWYRWPQPEGAPAKVRPFTPGAELTDLTLTLPRNAHLPLGPGRHEVRIAFLFEGVEVRSNPVNIEVSPTTR